MSTPNIEKKEIESWLIKRIAVEMDMSESEIQTTALFSSFNLDSIVVVTIAVDLETWLSKQIDPTIFWEFDTIEDLAAWLETHDIA